MLLGDLPTLTLLLPLIALYIDFSEKSFASEAVVLGAEKFYLFVLFCYAGLAKIYKPQRRIFM
jgi:hypothetical protein